MLPSYLRDEVWKRKYPSHALDEELKIPKAPLYEILDRNLERASWPAVTFYGKTLTYGELIELTRRFASGLQRVLGVTKGSRVGIMLPNIPQYPIAFFGLLRAGATVVPLNPLYTASELSYFIEDSQVEIIITLDIFSDKISELRRDFPGLKTVYTWLGEYMSYALRTLGRISGKLPSKRLRLGGQDFKFRDLLLREEPQRVDVDPEDDVAVLPYTGGTTGRPKGVFLTHYSIYSNVVQTCRWLFPPLEVGETTVIVLPIFHSFGQLHFAAAVYSGFRVVLLPRFEIKEYMSTIEKYKPTLISGVPTIYNMIVHGGFHKEYDVSGVKVAICAGDVLSPKVRDEFEKATGCVIIEGYGLTEASPAVTINPPYKEKRKPGTAGLPLPLTKVAILSLEEDRLLEVGERGEILVSGPQIMKGYKLSSSDQEQPFVEIGGERWLRTGDIGLIDEDGFLHMVDRKKDLIKYKGYSVFPKEIEEVLYMHPAVEEAAVIGVPHEEYGQIPKAYVVLSPEWKERVTEDDIIEHCRRHLAPYKVPKMVEFKDELPKSMIGKVLRRPLREEMEEAEVKEGVGTA